MRVVTFPRGMMARHVIKWMVIEHYHRKCKTEIRSGNIRRLPADMTYPLDDINWLQAAHDLAASYGLVLYQGKYGVWRIRTQTWKALKADILRERDG